MPQYEGQPVHPDERFEGAKASIRVLIKGEAFEMSTVVSDEAASDSAGYQPDIVALTLSERTFDAQNGVAGANLEVLKEGVDPFELDEEMRKFLSFICRREYEKVLVWEVETVDDIIMPFFEVWENGISYNSRGMGSGELSAFYILWAFRVVGPWSVVIIDEPEAFLPPSSHEAIMAVIAHYALAKRLAVIVSTHSPDIAIATPPQFLFSVRKEGQTRVIEPPSGSPSKVLSRLGLTPKRSASIYVEDVLIHDIVSEVIANHQLDMMCNFDICVRKDGASAVRKSIENSAYDMKHSVVFGVLDGDVLDEAKDWPEFSRLAFLPFMLAPEKELLKAAGRNPKKIAAMLGRDKARLHDALAEAEGLDHHDQFGRVAAWMGYSVSEFTRRAWQFWLLSAKGKAAEERLAKDIAKLSGLSV
ncbi:AAA family ATPase [Brevundimonas sp.]